MASLVVGGVTIPVAVSSPAWTRTDAVDRGRMFDGTFFASETGGATRDWTFSTTPVTQADADTYIAALSSPAAKLCSGDILQLPTMCSPELPSGKPTRAGASNRVVLDFMLHEIQPAKVLLRYAPGDTITGESFSRSTTAYQVDATETLISKAINAKRDGHYIGGVRSLLLENTRENICLQSEVLGTTWTTGNATIGANLAAAPDGAVTGDKIQEDNTTNSHTVTQVITCSSTVQSFSIWVRQGERTKCIVSMWDGVTGEASIGVDLLTGATFASGIGVGSWTGISARVEDGFYNDWYRVTITGTRGAGTQTHVAVYIYTTAVSYLGTTGSGIFAWGGQHKREAFSSSYIPTTTAAVPRGADSYSLPFTTPPQEMTVYAKSVERGTIATSGARIFQISNAADGTPEILCFTSGGFYRALYDNGSGTRSSILAVAPIIGDTVELVVRLFGDGSVDITQSINGGAATAGAQSAALALATAWSAQLAWLNSGGTAANTTGFTALQSFKIVAGARSLAEMRAL